ncbi:MAG: hypothetical protein RDU76_11590 [Candidatus Edwardsbacteria bacterium]|nr:hypothetical protein [Candidatus Edwardsbacteria bacterium]
MPRDLARNDNNDLLVNDLVSNDTIMLYYRQPSAEDHITYHARVNKVVDGKMQYDERARLDLAMDLLTGFRKGALTVGGKEISCDPQDPDYQENWRELIRDTAADWLMLLATVAYSGARREKKEPPFEKPSNN